MPGTFVVDLALCWVDDARPADTLLLEYSPVRAEVGDVYRRLFYGEKN